MQERLNKEMRKFQKDFNDMNADTLHHEFKVSSRDMELAEEKATKLEQKFKVAKIVNFR